MSCFNPRAYASFKEGLEAYRRDGETDAELEKRVMAEWAEEFLARPQDAIDSIERGADDE